MIHFSGDMAVLNDWLRRDLDDVRRKFQQR